MSTYYFRLDKLSVGYNGVPLIRDIEIGINRGEIVTLIGPNGAGKSTILKSISRQLSILDGRVEFDGREIREYTYKELSRKMAVVLTERMKPELMTCHDVVATGRYPYTGRLGILSREDEDKVEEALRLVHAAELGNKDFNAISDGQRQRVLLARAICQEPEIILLDEPTSFLDIRHKLELLAILRDMAKAKNITILMSLHEIDLAMKISDRILCVKGDHLFLEGTPEEVFREETIRDLYSIDNGFFDPMFGSIELPEPKGDSPVFVISSGGTGVPVYRQLQKENRPFVAGILCPNDIDYQLARLLAVEVIEEEPFRSLSEETVKKALVAVERCGSVLYAGVPIGESNAELTRVLDAAREAGKLNDISEA